ncbi:folate-binding protein YgfZ [Brevundimonas sp.]|uniref:CAF17-like 4Fe-4S cluster assembly/insertion protein YgfZ n=1 Tax=Brevundimonas sp. TaxID=1871086 RepID=UPI0035B2CE72
MTLIARLDSRALVRVAGPDARLFLHNLLTQDVEGLGEGELRFGALLSPPGRLLFDLFLWGEGDGVTLDVAADRRDGLIQRLSMYRLRAKVEIAADDRAVFTAWGEGPPAPGFVADPRLPGLGWRGLSAADPTADEPAWRAHELAHGVPGTPDSPPDKDYPIEANFDLLNGIDFAKGCFIGQETTSRMKRRGAIKNRMLPIRFDGPPPAFGAEVLLDGDRRAGEVRGGIDGRAMALLRLDRIDGLLTVDGRPIAVERPGWLLG